MARDAPACAWASGLQLRGGIDHVFTHWTADFVTELPNLARRYPTPLEVDMRNQNPWHSSGHRPGAGVLERADPGARWPA